VNLWAETKIAAEIGVVATERCAPGIAAASKHLVEEAMAQIFKKPTTLAKALPQISEVFSARNLQHGGAEVLDYLPTCNASMTPSSFICVPQICATAMVNHAFIQTCEKRVYVLKAARECT